MTAPKTYSDRELASDAYNAAALALREIKDLNRRLTAIEQTLLALGVHPGKKIK